MADRTKILAKIKAMMDKTVANGCTESEAMSAAAMVGKFMAEHDIMLSELNFSEEKCVTGTHQTDRYKVHPVHYCFFQISEYTGTKCWYCGGRKTPYKYSFFGLATDVEIAQYLMKLIYNCMEQEMEAFKTSVAYRTSKHGLKARDSFLKGMAMSINARLEQMTVEKKADMFKATGKDLVVVKDQVVEEEYLKLDLTLGTKKRNTFVNMDASYVAGQDAGKKIDLGINTRPNALIKEK